MNSEHIHIIFGTFETALFYMAKGLQNIELYFHLISIITGLKILQVNINKNLDKVEGESQNLRLGHISL